MHEKEGKQSAVHATMMGWNSFYVRVPLLQQHGDDVAATLRATIKVQCHQRDISAKAFMYSYLPQIVRQRQESVCANKHKYV